MNSPEQNIYLAVSQQAAIQASKRDPGQKICVVFDGMTPKEYGHVREEAALKALATGYYPFSPDHPVGDEFEIVETYLNGQLVTESEDEIAHPLTTFEDAKGLELMPGHSYEVDILPDGTAVVTGTFKIRTKQ